MRTIIKTEKAPAAVGPYSQAVRAGDLLFISGQLGLDMATGKIDYDSVEAQATQVLKNLQTIAEAAGTGLDNAVKISLYLTSMDDFDKVNAIYAGFFPNDPPARVCVEVARLPKGVAVEADAICVCP